MTAFGMADVEKQIVEEPTLGTQVFCGGSEMGTCDEGGAGCKDGLALGGGWPENQGYAFCSKIG